MHIMLNDKVLVLDFIDIRVTTDVLSLQGNMSLKFEFEKSLSSDQEACLNGLRTMSLSFPVQM